MVIRRSYALNFHEGMLSIKSRKFLSDLKKCIPGNCITIRKDILQANFTGQDLK